MGDRPAQFDYTEPTSVQEAISRRAQLGIDVQVIQNQLSSRDMPGTDGQWFSSVDYWQWHKKAKHALMCKQRELAVLKQYLCEHQKTKDGLSASFNNVLLKCLRCLLTGQGKDEAIGLLDELLSRRREMEGGSDA